MDRYLGLNLRWLAGSVRPSRRGKSQVALLVRSTVSDHRDFRMLEAHLPRNRDSSRRGMRLRRLWSDTARRKPGSEDRQSWPHMPPLPAPRCAPWPRRCASHDVSHAACRPPAVGPDDYDLIGNEREIVGRIVRARITPADTPWMWSLLTASNHAQQVPRRRDEAMQAAAEASGHHGWFARLNAQAHRPAR